MIFVRLPNKYTLAANHGQTKRR